LVLVVEDEDILVRELEERLIAEGFNVRIALNGSEGLELALKDHPDLILLDILLPKLNGAMMLKYLREDPWGSRVKVIILTNVKEPSMVSEMMKIGLSIPNNTFDYIVKTDLSLAGIVDKIKERLAIKS
jgi:DNA-binding response OmpR family regulator